MTGYIVRRLITAVIVVIGITLITFGLLQVVSSSPGRAILGLRASAPAVAAFNRTHGFDRPFILQYFTYLNQLIHGNLGYSYKEGQSVAALFKENAGRSAYLSGASLLLAILIAIPLGVFQAVKRNSIMDYAATGVTFTLYSMPSFFLAILLIDIFSFQFHIFPSEAAQNTGILKVFLDIRGMFLPILTLASISIASYSRYMRSSSLDNLAQDYMRLARAKGLPERLVLSRHLLRNSILPMVTLIGLSIPALLAGNLITEGIFNYPGIGYLFITALGNEDYPILLAYTLIAGILTVIGNLVADIAVTVADPRIRIS